MSNKSVPWSCLGALLTALVLGCSSAQEPSVVQPPPPATPVIEGVSPSSVAIGSTRDLRVTGRGFEEGVRIDFAQVAVEPGIATTTVSVTPTEVVARVTVAGTTPIGAFIAVATNRSGRQGTGGLLLVDQVAAEELPVPSGGGAVMVVMPTGVAFGIASGGCQSTGLGAPIKWDETGHQGPLLAPSAAGCDVTPMRESNGTLYGRGNPIDVNSSNSAIRWTGAPLIPEMLPVTPPPVGQRFVFDAVSSEGLFLGHARDTTVPGITRLVPFAWTSAGGWKQLQMPAGFLACVLHDANPSGEIVGSCYGPSKDQPVYWQDSGSPPTALPLPPGGSGGFGQAINVDHVMVGAVSVSGQMFAARWTRQGGALAVEVLPDQGTGAIAYNINDAGWIAGDVGPDLDHAALWSPAGAIRTLSRVAPNGFCAPNSIAASTPTTPPLVAGRCFRNTVSRPVIWRPT